MVKWWALLCFCVVLAAEGSGSDEKACDAAIAPAVDASLDVAAPGVLPLFDGVIKVIVRAPIHNPCQCKKFPALKKFWQEVHPRYRSSVDLKAFIQAPEFLFYGAGFKFLGSHTMVPEDTLERYEQLLVMNGLKEG